MRAVGFALTGNEGAEIKVIGNRTDCLFAVKNELFHLNNIYADAIKIQGWQRWPGLRGQGLIVTLQGDEIVYETTIEPPEDDHAELMLQMRVRSPELFKPHHYTYTQYELYLTTNDQDRVKSAWQYIYSHGCAGKPRP